MAQSKKVNPSHDSFIRGTIPFSGFHDDLLSTFCGLFLVPYDAFPLLLVLAPSIARIMMDRDTGKARGFAFVTFANVKDAEDAVAGLNGQVFSNNIFIHAICLIF